MEGTTMLYNDDGELPTTMTPPQLRVTEHEKAVLQTGLQAQVDTLQEQVAALRAQLQQAQEAEAATASRASKALAEAEALTAQIQQLKQVCAQVRMYWSVRDAHLHRRWQQQSRRSPWGQHSTQPHERSCNARATTCQCCSRSLRTLRPCDEKASREKQCQGCTCCVIELVNALKLFF